MRILLLSAYNAASHQYWIDGLLEQFPEYQWTVLTLPDRHFSWRLRGNSLTWAMGEQRKLLEQPWDLLIATSMVDLSSLRGMVPALTQVPTLVYFHENQFAYPRSQYQTHSPVEPQLQSIYTALCAERLLFNTEYNRQTFIRGAKQLLKKLPDQVPGGIVERLENTSEVLPVPLASDLPEASSKHRESPLLITWAARWEYDKGPARLLQILQQLEQQDLNYQLCLLGQAFRKKPKEFDQIEAQFKHRLVQFGYAKSRQVYLQWLQQSDVILSTSHHEFQGIAVLEAAACGATPVLPNEQSYPCLFESEHLYSSETEAVQRIVQLAQRMDLREVPTMDRFRWQLLRGDYQRVFKETALSQT